MTIGSSDTMDGDTPELGLLVELGSPEADTIKSAIWSKLREEVDGKDNTTPSPSKDLLATELDSLSKDSPAAELDLPAATPSPQKREMSNSNKRKAQSYTSSDDDTKEGSPDNVDKVIDDAMHDISDRLLIELDKQLSQNSSMPDIRL